MLTDCAINEGNESQVDILFEQLQKALDEEDRIITKMDEVFDSFPIREEADRIVSKRWSRLMNKAVEEVDDLIYFWLSAMKKVEV